jgi:hypothetical protein
MPGLANENEEERHYVKYMRRSRKEDEDDEKFI